MAIGGLTLAALSGGLKLMGSVGEYTDAKATARQILHKGEVESEERYQEGRTLKAKQITGYLSSGIAVDTGDSADLVIKDSWKTMKEDVEEIKSASKNNASNAISTARANLLGDVASTVGTFSKFI